MKIKPLSILLLAIFCSCHTTSTSNFPSNGARITRDSITFISTDAEQDACMTRCCNRLEDSVEICNNRLRQCSTRCIPNNYECNHNCSEVREACVIRRWDAFDECLTGCVH